MIPMVGAFIGGGIGAFIIFTVSPSKCLIFLIFLCIIQQIESNIFFPRVVGNKVGLPGIFVMMTIVIGGSLFGVPGMILGVPLVASGYKIFNDYLAEVMTRRNMATKDSTLKKTGSNSKPIEGKFSMKDSSLDASSQEGSLESTTQEIQDESQKLFKITN